MEPAQEMLKLLAEIRDLQREHLEEYRKTSRTVLNMQDRAILGQKTALRNQKIALGIVCVGVLFILGVLFLSSLSPKG